MSFRALREGVGVFASKARYGPTPLRSGFWRNSGGARRKARSGPFPLLYRVGQIQCGSGVDNRWDLVLMEPLPDRTLIP